MLNDQELYGAKLKVTMDHFDSNITQMLPKGLKSVGPGLGVMGVHLRDVVRQYERYLKGFKTGINSGLFQGIDGNNYCKTVPRHMAENYTQVSLKKSSNNMPIRQKTIPQPVPPVFYVGNYRPFGPINYGAQNIPGPMGHSAIPSHMGPNPGLPGHMVPNIPIKCPIGPVRPMGPMGNSSIGPPRHMGPNIPGNGPRAIGPNIGPVPAPIGPVPKPGNSVVAQPGPVGDKIVESPCVSPGPISTLANQQLQDHFTVELTNVCTDYYLFIYFIFAISCRLTQVFSRHRSEGRDVVDITTNDIFVVDITLERIKLIYGMYGKNMSNVLTFDIFFIYL